MTEEYDEKLKKLKCLKQFPAITDFIEYIQIEKDPQEAIYLIAAFDREIRGLNIVDISLMKEVYSAFRNKDMELCEKYFYIIYREWIYDWCSNDDYEIVETDRKYVAQLLRSETNLATLAFYLTIFCGQEGAIQSVKSVCQGQNIENILQLLANESFLELARLMQNNWYIPIIPKPSVILDLILVIDKLLCHLDSSNKEYLNHRANFRFNRYLEYYQGNYSSLIPAPEIYQVDDTVLQEDGENLDPEMATHTIMSEPSANTSSQTIVKVSRHHQKESLPQRSFYTDDRDTDKVNLTTQNPNEHQRSTAHLLDTTIKPGHSISFSSETIVSNPKFLTPPPNKQDTNCFVTAPVYRHAAYEYKLLTPHVTKTNNTTTVSDHEEDETTVLSADESSDQLNTAIVHDSDDPNSSDNQDDPNLPYVNISCYIEESGDSDSEESENRHNETIFMENGVPKRYGPYKFHKFLGQGSFSKVYEATKTGSSKIYAVKVIRFEEYVTKDDIIFEIKILEMMSTTGRSVELYHSFFSDYGAVIVMEKAKLNMKEFLESKDREMDHVFILHYWKLMMLCVQALHDKRFAHLDLKMQNFVITDDVDVKLIDYGTSQKLKNMDVSINRDQRQVGTVVFMSPQIMRNCRDLRPRRSDIWSMGVVLYFMVYRRQLTDAVTFSDYVCRITDPNFKISYPSQPPRTSPLLIELLQSCLQYEEEDRPSSTEIIRTISMA